MGNVVYISLASTACGVAYFCCGARTSGRRPWPGVGGTPRVAGLFLVAPWKPPLCPGSPAKDGDGCAASLAGKKSRVSRSSALVKDIKNAHRGVYEWKTLLVFALRMHSSQPLQLEPAVCRRKLDLLPSER